MLIMNSNLLYKGFISRFQEDSDKALYNCFIIFDYFKYEKTKGLMTEEKFNTILRLFINLRANEKHIFMSITFIIYVVH